VRFVPLAHNFGWAGGYNRALDIAVNENHAYGYLLNNDTTVTAGFLHRAMSCLDDKTASVGSQILESNGSSVKFDGDYYNPGQKKYQPQKGCAEVGDVNGAGMLISLRAFEKVGPFDERFFCYGEEKEWCHRASRLHGYRLCVSLDSVVMHECEGSDLNANALYYRTRNQFLTTPVRSPCPPALRHRAFRNCERFRRESANEKAAALMCAVQYGSRGEFGLRRATRPGWVTAAIALAYRSQVAGQIAFAIDRILTRMKKLVVSS